MAELDEPCVYPDSDDMILDLLKLEAATVFNGHSLANLSIDKYYDHLCCGLVYKLRTMVPAENVKEETHTVSVEYPDGWWNPFKDEYVPEWILRDFPVKYATKKETVTFTAYNMYPKFPEVYPECENGRQIIIKHVK